MKHTQGKWTAKIHKRARVRYGIHKGEPCGRQEISIRTDADTRKNHICDVIGYDHRGSGWTSRKEAKANANLMALAPEMLEMLKICAFQLPDETADEVSELIDRAEGK